MTCWRFRPSGRRDPSRNNLITEHMEGAMKRRKLLQRSAAFGLAAAFSPARVSETFATSAPSDNLKRPAAILNPLKPPAEGSIPVAFLISVGAVLIDFAGAWEVFRKALMSTRMDAFRLYTVGETTNPVRARGGMQIIPDFTLENAPAPKVIVIPAQNGASDAMLEWIRKSAETADVTMSVCTGAFILAKTGLLAGQVRDHALRRLR